MQVKSYTALQLLSLYNYLLLYLFPCKHLVSTDTRSKCHYIDYIYERYSAEKKSGVRTWSNPKIDFARVSIFIGSRRALEVIYLVSYAIFVILKSVD